MTIVLDSHWRIRTGVVSPKRPDRVAKDEEHPESPVFELDTADGGILRLPIISIGNSITTGTLYKKKQPR